MPLHIRLFFTLILFFAGTDVSIAQNFPTKPNTLVNDYTNTLSPDQVARLEQKLVAFDDSTSTQVAVVLINSLEGYDVADYAVHLAEQWGIGRAKKNNGIILLASIGDRKVTIQTGYGVEGALPDAIAKRIIEREIKPNFREGNYYQGIEQGTDAIIAYTKGEYKNTEAKKNEGSKFPFGIIILVIIVLIILARRGGGGRRVIGGRGGADLFWWTLMSGAGRHHNGGGWGGFSGGSGGGGFGGFGGGSFGGGGASGDW